ncbi:unnamed protein product [Ectocarpus fasciculatus]
MFDRKAGLRLGERAGSLRFQSQARQLQTRGCALPTSTTTRRAVTTYTTSKSTSAVSPACHPRHAFALASRVAEGNGCTQEPGLGKGSRARFGTRRSASGHINTRMPLQFQVGDSSLSSSRKASGARIRMHHPQGQRRFLRGSGQHFPHSDQESLGLYSGDGKRRVVKPERIIIVRHGESLGNRDESTYVHVPDWKIPLTKKGFGEGQKAGEKIKEYIGDKPLFIYTSPYLRTKQTLAGMVEAFDTNYIVGVREEPRLTEQQFGNFQNLATIVNSKAERARFGRFYYRFPQGESGLDVYNRATSFIATMFRDFANESIARDDLNVIIVTHGLTLRLLVMRWFQYSIADFEETLNPENGSFVVMERKEKEDTDSRFFQDVSAERRDLRHWYELTPESRAHINFKEQRQFGSLWKLLSELPDEPGVLPEEFMNKTTSEDPPNKNN